METSKENISGQPYHSPLRGRFLSGVGIKCGVSLSTLSVPICRLLAREGISADQLTRDLKSFELKVQSLSLKQMYAPTIYG